MFSDELKEWISDYAAELFGNDVDEAIALFEMALQLPSADEKLRGVIYIYPETLEEFCRTGRTKEYKKKMELFVKQEQFAKFLFSNIAPERYACEPREETDGLDRREWTLEPLLKQAFGIVPKDTFFSLETGKPERVCFPYKSSYLNVYKYRNGIAHNFEVLSPVGVNRLIQDGLVVMLDLSKRNGKRIRELYEEKILSNGFSAIPYCRKIISSYKQKQKDGFTYVDIKWQNDTETGTHISSVDKLVSQAGTPHIKLRGEAGSGKTTALEQLAFMDASAYMQNKRSKIPGLIPLGILEKNPEICPEVKKLLARQLEVSDAVLDKMLENGSLNIYLDGFNEILDVKQKKRFAFSLDNLAREYPEVTIILADRAILKSNIRTLSDAAAYHLYPLDSEMIRQFIKGNCCQEAIRDLLLDSLEKYPEFWEHIRIPIQMIHLIQVTQEQGQLPLVDFEGKYIEYLFRRESEEKKDENVEYLPMFAAAIAVRLDMDETLTMSGAEALIAKVKMAFGYSVPDAKVCLRLLIEMKILVYEEEHLQFAQEAYQLYFWELGYESGIDDLIQ